MAQTTHNGKWPSRKNARNFYIPEALYERLKEHQAAMNRRHAPARISAAALVQRAIEEYLERRMK